MIAYDDAPTTLLHGRVNHVRKTHLKNETTWPIVALESISHLDKYSNPILYFFLGKFLQDMHTWIGVVFSHTSWNILSSSIRPGSHHLTWRSMSESTTMAGPLRNIQRLVLKPLQHWLYASVVAMLKGKPSHQSEVVWTLERVFFKDSLLTSLLVPATVKHIHSMKLPPPCFTL